MVIQGDTRSLDNGSYGTFPKSGDPNIDPKILESLILGPPKKVPLILGNSHITPSQAVGIRQCGSGRVISHQLSWPAMRLP